MQAMPPITPPIIAPVCLGLGVGTGLVVEVKDALVGLVLEAAVDGELPVGCDGGLHAVFTI